MIILDIKGAIAIAFFMVLNFTIKAQDSFLYAPELFSPTISSGLCGFSRDGNTIYYVQEDTVLKKMFVYRALRKKNRWINPQILPFSGQYNDVGGRLTPDGNTFYFTSDRPGGSSLAEDAWNIWTSSLIDGTWSDPIPLLDVNSKGMECCPLPISKDVLMFSSDRKKATSWWIATYTFSSGVETFLDSLNGERFWQWPSSFANESTLLLNSMGRNDGFGKDDIYVSFLKNGIWSKPVNIGPAVNTAVYEDGAMLTPDKKYLLFMRHDTPNSPSKVFAVAWLPVLKEIKKKQRHR